MKIALLMMAGAVLVNGFRQALPTDLGLIERLSGLGLGAVVAAIVLIWKRNDDQHYIQTLEGVNSRLLKTLEDTTAALSELQGLVRQLADVERLEARLTTMEERLSRGRSNQSGD